MDLAGYREALTPDIPNAVESQHLVAALLPSLLNRAVADRGRRQ